MGVGVFNNVWSTCFAIGAATLPPVVSACADPPCSTSTAIAYLGASAGADLTAGSNNIDIGNRGVAGESGVTRIGTTGTQTSTYVAGVWQAPITGTAASVRVNSSGKLGTVPSSRRFKEAIRPMDSASEAILALQPVSFRYKKEHRSSGLWQRK